MTLIRQFVFQKIFSDHSFNFISGRSLA